jgi:oligosaccharide repeat unit polymerase
MALTWAYGLVGSLTLALVAWKRRDIFAPHILYILVFSFFLGIESLRLSRLQGGWTSTTILLFFGSAALFIGSGIIVSLAHKIHFPKWTFRFDAIRESLQRDASTLNWNWFKGVFFFCTAFYLFGYLLATLLYGTIPLLAKNPDEARVAFYTVNFISSLGLFFGPLSLILGTEFLIFGAMSRRTRWVTATLMVIVISLYLTIAMRLDLFRFFVFAMVLYHYGKKPIGFKQAIVATVGLTVLFVGIYLLRVRGADAVDQLNEMVQVKMPKRYFWASQIYAYVVSNFWNMDYAFRRYVEGSHYYPMSWGFELLRGVMYITGLESHLQIAYRFDSIFNDSINYVKGLNSTVYVWHFYKDFGAIGVYVQTLLFGLALSLFYSNTMRKPTLMRISFWGLFSGILIFSITAELWAFWFMYLNFGGIYLAHRKSVASPQVL